MTRLTKEQKHSYRIWFEDWRKPERMLLRARALMRVTSDELFSQPGIDFVTEAWAAATFSALRGANAVRLVPERERWPDFELRLDSHQES